MPSPVITVATISTTHISSHRVPTLHSHHFATATIYNIDFIAFTLPPLLLKIRISIKILTMQQYETLFS
jgi:hypothetical protein